jgi:multicomponent K+:H+ antiporter subunit E
MSRLVPAPAVSVLLALSWIALTDSSAAHIVLAIVLAISIPILAAPFLQGLPRARRPLRALLLVGRVVADVVVANVAVARLVLGRMERPRPAFLEVPLDVTNTYALTLLATIITMTPGTVSAALSPDARVLYVHALNVDDTAALVATIKRRYERLLMEILEC